MRLVFLALIFAALAVFAPNVFAQDDDNLVDLFSRQMDDRAIRWVCPTEPAPSARLFARQNYSHFKADD